MIRSISAPWASLMWTCWSSSTREQRKPTAIYPEWRGGYYFAGKPKGNKSATHRIALHFALVGPAKSGGVCRGLREVAHATLSETSGARGGRKVAADAPPADSWRTLRGSHAWMTEEGAVVIDVRGDTVLISESLDDQTTKTAADDYWSPRKAIRKIGACTALNFRLV